MGCDGCELWMPDRGVEHCYAGTLHTIRGGNPGYAEDFLKPKLFQGRMAKAARWSDLRGKARPDKPWLDGLPRVIFVSDMGDALSRDVPFLFLNSEVIQIVRSEAGRRHVWMWLTKLPHRMAEFARWIAADREERGVDTGCRPWPRNLWAGTSITEARYKGRVRHLLEVPADVRFLSVEPLVDDPGVLDLKGISLVIVGGESGPKARPFSLTWARALRDQCRTAGCAYFFKQAGSHARDVPPPPPPGGSYAPGERPGSEWRRLFHDPKGGDWTEWPSDLRVRQFPAPASERSARPAAQLDLAGMVPAQAVDLATAAKERAAGLDERLYYPDR